MVRPVWFVNLLKKTFPNIKFIAKLTRVPLIGKFIDLLLFKGDSLFYLVNDKVIEINKSLPLQAEMVLPSEVAEYFVRKSSVIKVMNFCICRDANKCKDYPIDFGCLFLGEAANGINPELSRTMSQDEAIAYLKRCRDAGLIHLIGRNKLDTVWLNVKPGSKLLTICNCCSCCCLWRIIPDLKKSISHKVSRMPGIKITVSNQCAGCGRCTENVCFADAIHIINERAVISDNCKGCGRCIDVCARKAIVLTIDDKHFINEAINQIEFLVDVS